MIKTIQSVFSRAAAIFGRGREVLPSVELRNFDEEAAKREFRQRYLGAFAELTAGEVILENSIPVFAYIKLLPVTLPIGVLLSVVGVGVPVVAVASIVYAGAYAFLANPALSEGIAKTARDLAREDDGASFKHVEVWMTKHIDQIPEYLDRLDRREEDLKRRKMLLARQAANPGVVFNEKDRALLARYDVRKFRTRATNPTPLPPQAALLGNWHYTQLSRALRHDLVGGAGGGPCRQMLKLMGVERLVRYCLPR